MTHCIVVFCVFSKTFTAEYNHLEVGVTVWVSGGFLILGTTVLVWGHSFRTRWLSTRWYVATEAWLVQILINDVKISGVHFFEIQDLRFIVGNTYLQNHSLFLVGQRKMNKLVFCIVNSEPDLLKPGPLWRLIVGGFFTQSQIYQRISH